MAMKKEFLNGAGQNRDPRPYEGLDAGGAYTILAQLYTAYCDNGANAETIAQDLAKETYSPADFEAFTTEIGYLLYDQRNHIHESYTTSMEALEKYKQRATRARQNAQGTEEPALAVIYELAAGRVKDQRRLVHQHYIHFHTIENDALDFENALLSVDRPYRKRAENLMSGLYRIFPWPPQMQNQNANNHDLSGFDPG